MKIGTNIKDTYLIDGELWFDKNDKLVNEDDKNRSYCIEWRTEENLYQTIWENDDIAVFEYAHHIRTSKQYISFEDFHTIDETDFDIRCKVTINGKTYYAICI